MIRLVQYEPIWGLPNVSPPCMKLETWLRMADIPYQLAPLELARAPKGKVPYIIEEDGQRIGDSTFIIEHLTAKHRKDLDAVLPTEQRAISLAFRRMMKENLYWVIVYSRYREESNWIRYRQMIMASSLRELPEAQRGDIADAFRKVILDQLHGHGMGRHTAAEAYRVGIADLTAISDYLGSKPFFMGEQLTTVDATLYATLANIIEVPIACAVKDFGRSRENLVRYCQRMGERFFPEFRPSIGGKFGLHSPEAAR